MTDRKRLYLIDGSGYVFRAYHAIQRLSNSKGFPTNALFGFTGMILKVLKDERPDRIAVVLDAAGKTFRDDMYAEYKANRPPMPPDLLQQWPVIHEILRGYRLPTLEVEGVEADDVIATLARRGAREGYEVVIVTGDKDLMQLVGGPVSILDTMKDKRYGPKEVEEKMGVPPERVVDFLALQGDAVDNVPGVPGVGEKTAQKLLQQFGSLDALLERASEVDRPKLRESIEKNRAMALLSRRLVTLRDDVPLEVDLDAMAPQRPDVLKLQALFGELEFGRFAKELGPVKGVSYDAYRAVTTEAALAALAKALLAAEAFSFDTETTSVDPMEAEVVGLSFSWAAGEAAYIPVAHRYLGAPAQLARERVLEVLRPAYASEVPKYAQNAKYDLLVLTRAGVEVRGLACDTMVASYVLDPSRRSHSLEELARQFLGHQMITFEDVTGKGKKQIGFDQVDVERAKTYSCEDADVTLRLASMFLPRIEEEGLTPLFRDIEMPLIRVLLTMERNGVKVDLAHLVKLSEEFAQELLRIQGEIFGVAGEEFNIESPKQLQAILFGKLGLRHGRKTKTGWSTDADVLASLAKEHPLPAKILDYRALAKLKHGYVDALPSLVKRSTGRIHTSFNQTVAATGRLSSSDPNLQNIPIRTPEGKRIREAFVADEGCELVSLDYSQIELRILAHLAGDEVLKDAFAKDEDVHTRTACEVFNVTADLVSSEMRRQAKAINFGIVYGMSEWGLAAALGVAQEVAKAYIEHYFKRYAGVKRYLEGTLEGARKDQYVTTMLKRRRYLPDISSSNPQLRGMAERMAVNTPIQGTAADLMKVAMVRVQGRLEGEKFASRMILQVHDELVFEVPGAERERLLAMARGEMEGALALDVRLKVDVAIGTRWGEMRDLE